MALSVRDGAAWKAVNNLHVYGYASGSTKWHPLKVLWAMHWTPAQEPGQWVQTWKKVLDLIVPTDEPPGVGIARGTSFLPPDAVASWTVVTDPTLPMYDASVNVRWYVNGIHSFNDTVPQGDGSVTRFFNSGDQVYARVQYFKNGSGGPWAQTTTIFL